MGSCLCSGVWVCVKRGSLNLLCLLSHLCFESSSSRSGSSKRNKVIKLLDITDIQKVCRVSGSAPLSSLSPEPSQTLIHITLSMWVQEGVRAPNAVWWIWQHFVKSYSPDRNISDAILPTHSMLCLFFFFYDAQFLHHYRFNVTMTGSSNTLACAPFKPVKAQGCPTVKSANPVIGGTLELVLSVCCRNTRQLYTLYCIFLMASCYW